MTKLFTPRDWQKYAADQCVALRRSGADRALIYACPGSGKTLGGLFIASELKRRAKLGPKIVILTPNVAIKSQWITRAALLGFELLPLTNVKNQLINDELDLKESGFVLNYQQAINCRTALRNFCERHNPIVILDEVHHTEGPRDDRDGNRWGAAVEVAFAPASFKICTTGTPFRQGNLPISFVQYNENGEAVANVRYTYSQAIIDGICRPIEFNQYEGEVSWHDYGKLVTADFSKPLTKRRSRQRLRAAISLEGQFTIEMLKSAHQRLMEMRSNSGVDSCAAGLVVAESVKHANEIADELYRIGNIKPVVVHNKIDDSVGEIDKFRDGDQPWIVGVAMISEGVDIPRLRVGVYATNVTAPLYFHQFCGRFSRVIESRTERSFVWMPEDPELVAIAKEIEKERFHALGDLSTEEKQPGNGSSGRRRQDIDVEDSNSELVAKTISGVRVPIDLIREHRLSIDNLRRSNMSCRHMSDAEVIKLMIDIGVIKTPEEAA